MVRDSYATKEGKYARAKKESGAIAKEIGNSLQHFHRMFSFPSAKLNRTCFECKRNPKFGGKCVCHLCMSMNHFEPFDMSLLGRVKFFFRNIRHKIQRCLPTVHFDIKVYWPK